MAQYTWKIESLESHPSVNGLEKVVSVVHWRLFGDDGSNTVSVYGSVNLEAPDSDNFSQYSTLTQDQIIEWTKAALGQDRVNAFYESVNNQLSTLLAPQKVPTELPWA